MTNKLLENLNEVQREAVQFYRGNLLILSGAGSGKTRVITHRIAYLLQEYKVSPFKILGVTFTNKASAEMRERLDNLLGEGMSKNLWISTFHSSCARILRRDIEKLNDEYTNDFTIYDASEQRTLISICLKEIGLKPKDYSPKSVLFEISKLKNNFITPDVYFNLVEEERDRFIAHIYSLYQKYLKQNNALDFDDLQIFTINLFNKSKSTLEYYQNKFEFILVDEYQDTNPIQYNLIRLLSGKHQNLCVVGDDDQSIYSFRGTDITNILNFEKDYDNVKVLKLEQNYRSTQNILNTAWNVIQNNIERKEKKLWTQNKQGTKTYYYEAIDQNDEAGFVGSTIIDLHKEDKNIKYSDFAILYRTNAQSRSFEDTLRTEKIPYRIIGGLSFYDRLEIKDLLAYLKAINNTKDSVSLRRIINTPSRGIGNITIDRCLQFASANNISLWQALEHTEQIPNITKTAKIRLSQFKYFLKELMKIKSTFKLLQEVIDRTGYIKILENQNTVESQAKIENIIELINSIAEFESRSDNPTLSSYIESISLIQDVDSDEKDTDVVTLMTLHACKGLEFPYVFLVGMEEGLLPHNFSLNSDKEIEEERRICYVGMTRAMYKLYITSAQSRRFFGNFIYATPSRFLSEIPQNLIKIIDRYTI